MKSDMPKAVFFGLALIAAAIFFGPGSTMVSAHSRSETQNLTEWRTGVSKWIGEHIKEHGKKSVERTFDELKIQNQHQDLESAIAALNRRLIVLEINAK